jgi:hypothetical protein
MTVVLLVAAEMLGNASPGFADPPPPSTPVPPTTIPVTVDADGWITYGNTLASSLSLVAPSTKTITGKVGGDGACIFSDSGALASGSFGTFEEEIAFNPLTCQQTLISGQLTSASLAMLNSQTQVDANLNAPSRFASKRVGAAAKAATRHSPSAAAATQYKKDFTKSAYIDPLTITIASFTANLRWPLAGAAGTPTGNFVPYHYYFGVWSVSGTPPLNIYRIYNPNGYALQGAETITNWEFSAVVAFLLGPPGVLLCAGLGPALFNFDETTYGRNDGSGAYSTNHSKSGACTNLTHYAHWSGFGWSS